MEEVVRRCDFPVRKGRQTVPCGKQIDATQPSKFALAGREYVVDLCDDHEPVLTERMQEFIEIARRVSATTPRNTRGRAIMRGKGGATFTTKDVRLWLEQQGKEVAPTGRIPNSQIDEYKLAHGLA